MTRSCKFTVRKSKIAKSKIAPGNRPLAVPNGSRIVSHFHQLFRGFCCDFQGLSYCPCCCIGAMINYRTQYKDLYASKAWCITSRLHLIGLLEDLVLLQTLCLGSVLFFFKDYTTWWGQKRWLQLMFPKQPERGTHQLMVSCEMENMWPGDVGKGRLDPIITSLCLSNSYIMW